MTQQRPAKDAQTDLQLEAELRRLRRDDQQLQPDWSAMQASISLAVAQLPVPRLPWWRRWSVMAPVTGALLASAAAVMVWRVQAAAPSTLQDAPVVAALAPADARPVTPAAQAPLILDGEDLDIASIDEIALQQAFWEETQAAADTVASDDSGGAADNDDDGANIGVEPAHLVPSSLQWVDGLAADELDELDRWLDSQIVKKG